ncbi:MAG TPA: hypothetical protein HPP83_06830 [Candidatus Hydrogenedentes bacterium]|nr:hypothetical protein [Candidatus Hydrogenedentota bacterium]
MNRSKCVSLFFVVTVLIVGSTKMAWGYWYLGPWEVYEGISGLGDVYKSSPAEDDLHYGGTGSPETATFGIATAGAEDIDRAPCYYYGQFHHWVYADAGLNASQTNWQCTAGAIDDGSFATTYTPGNTPQSGIIIKATVYDGLTYNTNDPGVTKQYPNTITVYRVGVHLSTSPGGGNYKKWEDETTEGSVPEEDLYTNLNVSGNNTDTDIDTCTGKWTLVTDPSGCDIHGVIQASSSSSASGTHSLFAADTDLWDGGFGACGVSVSVLVITFSYGWNISGDTNVAIVSSCIAYGSDYGTEYEEDPGLTLVSTVFTEEACYEDKNISAYPGSGQWSGKEGADRDGKWETKVKCTTKEDPPSTANGQGGASADCTFDIPNRPYYQ